MKQTLASFVTSLLWWALLSQGLCAQNELEARRRPVPVDKPIRFAPDFLPQPDILPFPGPPFPGPRPLPPRPQPSPPKKSIETLKQFYKSEVYQLKQDKALDFKQAPPGYTLTTDKTVYRPGETVLLQVYFYNKYTKAPHEDLDTLVKSNPKVVLRDARDQELAKVKAFGRDGPVLTAEIPLEADQPGGFHRLEFSNAYLSLVQRQTIFVLSFGSPNEILTIETNKDFITGGDRLIAEISLKLLKRAAREGELGNLEITVRAVGTFGRSLASATVQTSEAGVALATLDLPKNLQGAKQVTLSASVNFSGREVRASKDLKVASLDDLAIDFRPGTGKWVEGMANRVYFQAFASRDKKAEFVVEDAHVVVKKNKGEREKKLRARISSEDNGMGRFSIKVRRGFEYFLRVAKQGKTRDFRIVNGDNFKTKRFSNVMMRLTSTVLTQKGSLSVRVRKAKGVMAKSVWLVVQDKTKVLHESELKLKGPVGKKTLRVASLGVPNGGVLTVQLFRKKSFGQPDQESLVYVHPRKRVEVGVTQDSPVYLPGATVRMDVNHRSGEPDMLWAVVVSDETATLQVEKKRHPPSLVSKVFLENELFFASKEFQGAHRYVDWFFENGAKRPSGKAQRENNRRLDVLLGNQGWRDFFLAGDKISQIVKRNDSLGKKGHFEYLLGKRLSDLRPKFDTRFRRRNFPIMLAMQGAPMAFAARGGAMQNRARRGPRGVVMQDANMAMEMVGARFSTLTSRKWQWLPWTSLQSKLRRQKTRQKQSTWPRSRTTAPS